MARPLAWFGEEHPVKDVKDLLEPLSKDKGSRKQKHQKKSETIRKEPKQKTRKNRWLR